MKKYLHMIVLLAIGFSVNAQSISTKKAANWKEAKPMNVLTHPSNLEWKHEVQLQTQKVQMPLKTWSVKDILYAKETKKGYQTRMVRLNNAQIVKQIIKSDKNSIDRLRIDPNRRIAAAAKDTSLYEGFEGWDGTTANWLPRGWTNDNKSNSPDSFRWQTVGGQNSGAYRGRYMAGVQFAYEDQEEGTVFHPSEEWLITPAFTPKSIDRLFFKLNYNAGWLLINLETMEFDAINQEIEVWVSTNNGGSWTKLWDVLDHARSYSEEELWDLVGSLSAPWSAFSVNLSAYAGQSIKLAFRYNNREGESAYLDEIMVGAPVIKALYQRPDGYFYWTLGEEYLLFSTSEGMYSALLGPAYQPAEWHNLSYGDVDGNPGFSWQFTDINDFQRPLELTDVNPVIAYPYAMVDVPVLTASATGAPSSSYTWDGLFLQTGGAAEYTFSDSPQLVVMGAGNYDIKLGFASSEYKDKAYVFGTGSDDFWASTGGRLVSIANYFEKPLKKYMFDRFWIHCGQFAAAPDAELQLIIHRVVDNQLMDTIATSVCRGSEVQHVFSDANAYDYCVIPFTFKEIDPETGREADTYLEIEDAMMVELKGFTDGKVTSMDPFLQADDSPTFENNAYVFLEGEDGQQYLFPVSYFFDWYSSFTFNMNARYSFMLTDDNRYAAPAQGGTKTFEIISYWTPDTWWYDENEVPAWITFGEPVNNTNTIGLPVQVAALPAGVAGRNANVKIYSYACDMTLQIKQGDADWPSGLPAVKTLETVRAVLQGDHFLLSYPPSATSVSVYTLTGQSLGTYPLNASGTSVLPAANWTQGVYILRFNGVHAAVKVIK